MNRERSASLSESAEFVDSLRKARALAEGLTSSIARARSNEYGWQRNWNEEFLQALESSDPDAAVQTLIEDFHKTALLFGSLIISERGLPVECRTIVSVGGGRC